MDILERFGLKSKEQKAQEAQKKAQQERESQTIAKKREILALETRIREVKRNVEIFGWAPADTTLINNLEERMKTLNREIKALGGSPVRPPIEESFTRKQPERPF